MGIISQPENRSVEEPDQPDGTLSKRKSLTAISLILHSAIDGVGSIERPGPHLIP